MTPRQSICLLIAVATAVAGCSPGPDSHSQPQPTRTQSEPQQKPALLPEPKADTKGKDKTTQDAQEAEFRHLMEETRRQDEDARQLREEMRGFVYKAMPMMDACRKAGKQPISVSEQCIIWGITDEFRDLAEKEPHAAQRDLKGLGLEYRREPGPITIFLVKTKDKKMTGVYQPSFQTGYQLELEVDVVGAPDWKALGCYTVMGDPPPQTVKDFLVGPVYGDTRGPLLQLIASLRAPKGGEK